MITPKLPWAVNKETHRNMINKQKNKNIGWLKYLRGMAMMSSYSFKRNVRPRWIERHFHQNHMYYNENDNFKQSAFSEYPKFRDVIRFGSYPGQQLQNMKKIFHRNYKGKEYLVLEIVYMVMQHGNTSYLTHMMKELFSMSRLGDLNSYVEQYKRLVVNATRDDDALWKLYMLFKKIPVYQLRMVFKF